MLFCYVLLRSRQGSVMLFHVRTRMGTNACALCAPARYKQVHWRDHRHHTLLCHTWHDDI